MSAENTRFLLPEYDSFNESIAVLSLEISASELHGMMCGYLCAGADSQGEAYLRTLLNNKKDEASRTAFLVMFSVFSVSQQQINNFTLQDLILVIIMPLHLHTANQIVTILLECGK